MEELKTIVQIIGQGGISIVVVIIWYFTFSHMNKNTADAFRKHEELMSTLMQILKDEQEYKSHLVGILSRLEIKLDTPTHCPLLKEK